MFFKILKKDLQRKRTMNIILLIFIILAGTFISSSINNLVAISTAMDVFIEKSEIGDYLIMTRNDEKNNAALTDFIENSPETVGHTKDSTLQISNKNIQFAGNSDLEFAGILLLSSYNVKESKFFDENDKIFTVLDGEIYLSPTDMSKNNIKKGDKLVIHDESFEKEFIVKGSFKDVFMGSSMLGAKRMLISENDFQEFFDKSALSEINIWSVNVSDLPRFVNEFVNSGISAIFMCDQAMIRTCYIMDMIIASILIILSICLIVISMVMLRFTIVFTLQNEFREIGIMKAIGLQSKGIRQLYIIKYLAISVVGAVISLFLSIPFGNMLLKEVSRNIVMSGNSYTGLISIASMVFIVLVIMLFSYFCTNQVNKFSAIDAIRNGSNGERFKRKSVLRLKRCGKLPAVLYMAVNDILSGLKRFGTLIVIFTLGIVLVIVPVNTINTLSNDNIVKLFGMAKSDAYIISDDTNIGLAANVDKDYLTNYMDSIHNELKENEIDTSVFIEVLLNFKVTFGETNVISKGCQGVGIDTSQYDYLEGVAPKYNNEVALTKVTADALGAKIGDTVKVGAGESEKEYIVTAIYQSMANMGAGIRFSEKETLDYSYVQGCFAIQLRFADGLTPEEQSQTRAKIAEIYPTFKVYTGVQYTSSMMGGTMEQIESVKQLILMVVLGINMLVTVLMVKSFISKERGEIGMLKSIGFRDSSVVLWQTARIGIVMLIATILGSLISEPIAQISSAKIFEMMGAGQIQFVVNPFEIYFLYPLIIFVLTTLSSAVTALQIKRISSQETNNVE